MDVLRFSGSIKLPVPETVAWTGSDKTLFIAGKGNIMWMDLSKSNPVWKSVGKYENIKAIAGADWKVVFMNNKGELLESKSPEAIKWKTIGSVDQSVAASVCCRTTSFMPQMEMVLLWVADLSRKSIVWTKPETVNNIVSLAANNGKLYALTNDGIIYQCETGKKDQKWLKIAYRNGIDY